MRIFLTLFFLIFCFKITFAFTCVDAKLDENKFINAAVDRMLTIARMRTTIEMQDEMISKVAQNCVDVAGIAKRIIGRGRWEALTEAQRENFLRQYPLYFVYVFRGSVIAAISDVQGFEWRLENPQTAAYRISFKHKDKTRDFEIILNIKPQNGYLKITDASFEEQISLVQSEKQKFDMEYDKNNNFFKEFNAKKYFNKK